MERGLSLEHFSEGPRWEGLTIAKKGQGGDKECCSISVIRGMVLLLSLLRIGGQHTTIRAQMFGLQYVAAI